MESEKVKEIKKALEHCMECDCENCPRSSLDPPYEDECRLVLIKQILTLINELESENKTFLESKTMWKRLHTELCKENRELKAENERWQEKEGALSCDLEIIREKLTNAEIEVDDYKNRIAEGELVSKDWHDEQIGQAENRIVELEKELNERVIVRATKEANILNEIRENARREALTQFFEKVKDKLKDNVDADRVDYYVEFTTFMSSTLIEMLEKRCSNDT